MHRVVAPVFHTYEVPPETPHNWVDPPLQIEVFPVMLQETLLSVMLHVLVHPPEEVTVTWYVPATDTLIHCVVAPVLHAYAAIPTGAHNVLGVPGQTEVLPDTEHDGGTHACVPDVLV